MWSLMDGFTFKVEFEIGARSALESRLGERRASSGAWLIPVLSVLNLTSDAQKGPDLKFLVP